jgi:glucan biosynthesis protein C
MSSQLELTTPHAAEAPRALEQARPEAARSRLSFVDNLRVALTALVVIHHLAVTYGFVAPWYYIEVPQDPITSPVLLFFVLFNQAYFMGLFFLISGYFTPGSYDRKGPRAFLTDRLLRLGVPLLIFIVLLGPLSSLIGFESVAQFVPGAETLTPVQIYLGAMGPGPLWFVEALLIFAGLYALWRWLAGNPAAPEQRDSAPPSYRALIAFALGLAAATFVLRIWVPIGWSLPILGFPTSSHLPQYIGLFIAGMVAYRRNWLLSIPERMGRAGFIAAFVATLVLFPVIVVFGLTDGVFTGGMRWPAAVYALWEAIFCVGMVLGLLTLFRKRFDRQGALGRFLSVHAYTVYILHALVIVLVAYALAPVHTHALLKFALAALIGVPLCFVAAFLVRKLPFAQKVL